MARLGRGYPIPPHIFLRIAAAYPRAVLAGSPLLYWRLGETSGTVAADSSGNAHDGTYIGSPTLGTASLIGTDSNKAMTVAANSGQRATIASAAWMNVSNLTVIAAVNFSSAVDVTNGDAIVSRYDGTGFNWTLNRSTTGVFQAQIRNTSGTAYNVFGPAVTLGTTYYAGFTYDGSNFILYVNGVAVDSVAVTGTVQTGSAPIEAGQYSGSSSTTPGATIDEVAVYGTALSSSQIAAQYAAGTLPYAAAVLADSPVAYYRLGEASGTTMIDASGNGGRDGTYVGSPTLGTTGLLTADANTAVTFNGANTQHGDVTSATWMDMTGGTLTMEALIKPTVVTGSHNILSRDPGSSQYRMLIGGSSNLQLLFYPSSGGIAINSTGTLAANTRYHVAITWDGTNVRFYINGVLDSTVARGGTMSAGSSALVVGALRPSDGLESFAGVIDEVALYSTALSGARIAAHYFAAGSGSATISGTAAAPLGALTVAGTGTRTHFTTSTVPLGALTVAATSVRKTFGTATAPLGALTVASAGGPLRTGTAAAPLGALTVTSSGFRARSGTVAVPLGALIVSSSGFRRLSGTASLPLGSLAVSGAGTVRHPGVGSVPLGSLTVASSGGVVHVISGTAAVLLGSVDMQAIGHPLRIPPSAISVLSAGSTSVTVTAAVSGVAYTSAFSNGKTVVHVSARGRQTGTVLAAGGTAVSVGVRARQLVSVTVTGRTVVTLLYTPDDGQGNNAGNDTPLFGNDPQISNNQPVTLGVALTGNFLSGEA